MNKTIYNFKYGNVIKTPQLIFKFKKISQKKIKFLMWNNYLLRAHSYQCTYLITF